MEIDNRSNAAMQDEGMMAMPGMSREDQLTYDPTQGQGTDAWQRSVKAQMEVNARYRRN